MSAPVAVEARHDAAQHERAELIRRIVDAAPPLNDAQLGRLAPLLAGRR